MTLSVSGLYSPSLEKNTSEFLGSNSPTPSPTTYKYSSESGIQGHSQSYSPGAQESADNRTTTAPNEFPIFHQQSPPPSALMSSKLGAEAVAGRPRGQSASARPTLRLHIANPTEPLPSEQNMAQEQAMRYALQTLQAKAQTANTGSTSPIRKRGETFSGFPRSNIRVATSNLTFLPPLHNTPNTSSSGSNSNPSSASAANPITKQPYRASPLVGPHTDSSASTAPTSVFSEEYYSSTASVSTASTPATQESVPEFVRTRRPLPVPPPPSAIGSATIPAISTIPSQVMSPMTSSISPQRPITPSTANHRNRQLQTAHGHEKLSAELKINTDLSNPISADLVGGRQGKQLLEEDAPPNSPDEEEVEEEIPYELRSEKWKGKQKMRDSLYNMSIPQFSSPSAPVVLASTPYRSDTDHRETGLPPSLSGTLSNRPSRASIASSHSSTRSIGVNEGGVSKWKGKGKEVLRTLSISSISSLEREASGGVPQSVRGRGKEVKKSDSMSSFANTFQAESPASSFSASPVAPHTSSASLALASHPSVLIPGYQPGPRIASPRPMRDMGRSSSPRAMWSPTPPRSLHVDQSFPLHGQSIASPATSPVIPAPAPKLPPKDVRYQHLQPLMFTQADDPDEEGRRPFNDVNTAYLSPSMTNSPADRPVDTGFGYAEPGYEDDERVYVDDGYDDPVYGDVGEDLDQEYGLGVSASGQLVHGSGAGMVGAPSAAASVSVLGHVSSSHSGITSSRVSLARESGRSPSPMRYARRRSLSEDDDDETPESNGIPVTDLTSSARPQVKVRSGSLPGHESFHGKNIPPSPVTSVSTTTQILSSLNPQSTVRSSPSTSPPDDRRGRRIARSPEHFDPTEILGEELEMSFSKNPSPTRHHPRKGIYSGSLAVLAEDKVYVRGKWRMRSPSPGMSPISPEDAKSGPSQSRATPGGIRRYASEESLLSTGVTSSEIDCAKTENSHSSGGGFAPLRSRGFEEFNLAPDLNITAKRFAERTSTPESFDSASHKNGAGSSGRHTPVLRGPGTKPDHADDFGFDVGWKPGTEVGRKAKGAQAKEPSTEGSREHEGGKRGGERSTTRTPAKLEKRRTAKRRGSAGGDSKVQRSDTGPSRRQTHVPQPPEHISYDLWVEQGMDQMSAAVKGKKTVSKI
ncbi:hypothetical protein BDP27DRAFT_1446040 [Rhodocollybia butyracea]|uniref:Uncharacterized protein n=1 Tax=Rhodocollybia butyracea TaxID=206335 RepID=A0A9P5Q0G1_9AGAR|nr:hypothetical protein BDP27DRAFT_1446040 [Rhodocollybia butyracea]